MEEILSWTIMPRPYTSEDYEALARAVLAGMPESEAEKTLEDQRKKGAKGEEVYWLTLKEGARTAKTTIQITHGLKAALDDLKKHKKESYQEVIERLISRYKYSENTLNALVSKGVLRVDGGYSEKMDPFIITGLAGELE